MDRVKRTALSSLVAILVIASLTSTPVGAAITSTSSAAQGNAYAAHVLAKAVLPVEAVVTTIVVNPILTNEPEPFLFPSGDQYDAHALYDVALSPSALSAYLKKHFGSRQWASDEGPPPPGVTLIQLELPVAGPNAQDAQDAYTIVANGTGSEVRVDAQVIWNPNRLQSEIVPKSGTVEVTGFAHGRLDTGAYGPFTVQVHGKQAQLIRRAFDGLAQASGPANCMENINNYVITFVPTQKSKVTFTATATGCAGIVSVNTPHGSLDPLLADCALTRSVLAVLPKNKVASTRGSTQSCLPSSQRHQ